MCHVIRNFSTIHASARISSPVSASRKLPEPSIASRSLVGRSATDFKSDQNTPSPVGALCRRSDQPHPLGPGSPAAPSPIGAKDGLAGLRLRHARSSCTAGARATTATETAAAAASSSSTAARRRPSRPPPDAPPPVLPPDRQPSSMPVTSGLTGSHAAVPRLGVSSSLGDGA